MKKQNYYISDKGEFVIEDYNQRKPFSSFLPAVAGLYGKPLWAYYVNRGQCLCTFGINNKDCSIMEFQPANKAYRQTSLQGFRTFLKIKDLETNKSIYYEPFQDTLKCRFFDVEQRMFITSYDLKLEEINYTLGMKFKVMFCTLPGENMPGLIRTLEIANISGKRLEIEVLDGAPMIIPYYIINNDLKNESNLRQAWMGVEHYNTLPFYRIKALPYDTPEIVLLEGGNFFINFSSNNDKLDFSRVVVDPALIFGHVTDLSYPQKFMEENFSIPESQVDTGITTCGFGYRKVNLEDYQTSIIHTLIGSAERYETLLKFVEEKLSESYILKKIKENKEIIESSKYHIFTSSNLKEFDLYCGQTFMDNYLRGGYPVQIGNNKHILYVYSRKHGDLEREYNFFQVDATNYSQGNSNFRDVNQNRRNDVYFFPFVWNSNIKTFFNLLQLDGFNPLVLKGSSFTVENKEAASWLIDEYFLEKDSEVVSEYIKKSFTPGRLLEFIEQKECKLIKDNAEIFMNKLLAVCIKEDVADFQEGYWVDHWTYNTDLLEQFIDIYPDQAVELLFKQTEYTYFDNDEMVVPRGKRYVLTKDGVRQYGALEKITSKTKMIKERSLKPNQVRVNFGKGEIYYCTLASKVITLILNKIASLDPLGVGVEMEGNKPGWCDALNGLPGILGSSINESTEIKRLALLMLEILKAPHAEEIKHIRVPEEVYSFFAKVLGLLAKNVDGIKYWDLSNEAKEHFRNETIFGISGKETDISFKEIAVFLEGVIKKVESGLEKAFNKESGIYYTYFINEAEQYEPITDKEGNLIHNKTGYPQVRITAFKQRPIPYFLEGPVHVLRLEKNIENARRLHQSIKKTGLYDEKLDMYKVNDNIMEETKEIGRQNVFPRGWLENEAIFLHMEYKYFLELLRSGLYEEFFSCIKNALIPFLDPEMYGRSTLENSSFIVSSVHTDEKIHGTGFVSRLTGASAEFLNMWRYMTAGKRPFILNEKNELCMELKPVLPEWLFTNEEKVVKVYSDMQEITICLPADSFAFNLLGRILTVYHNKKRKSIYEGSQIKITSIELYHAGKLLTRIQGSVVTGQYAEQVRNGRINRIEAYLE